MLQLFWHILALTNTSQGRWPKNSVYESINLHIDECVCVCVAMHVWYKTRLARYLQFWISKGFEKQNQTTTKHTLHFISSSHTFKFRVLFVCLPSSPHCHRVWHLVQLKHLNRKDQALQRVSWVLEREKLISSQESGKAAYWKVVWVTSSKNKLMNEINLTEI